MTVLTLSPTGNVIDLSPKKVDLVGLYAGDRNAIRITITAADEPLVLTGYSILAQARAYPGAENYLEAVIEDVDEEAGAFTMRWPVDEVLTGIGVFEGMWDLQIAASEEPPTTLAAGRFQARSDVSR